MTHLAGDPQRTSTILKDTILMATWSVKLVICGNSKGPALARCPGLRDFNVWEFLKSIHGIL